LKGQTLHLEPCTTFASHMGTRGKSQALLTRNRQLWQVLRAAPYSTRLS